MKNNYNYFKKCMICTLLLLSALSFGSIDMNPSNSSETSSSFLAAPYRYIRVVITDTNEYDATGIVLERSKLNDFRVGNTDANTWYSVPGGAWDTYNSGDPSSYQSTNHANYTRVLDLGAGNSVLVDRFDIKTVFDTNRTPRDFTIEGSNDGSSWEVIYTGTDFEPSGYASNTNNIFSTQALSVNDVTAKKEFLNVYTNYNKSLTIKTSLDNASILIVDLLGRTVYTNKMSGNEHQVTNKTLKAGIYIVRIDNENSAQSKKIVVQ